MPEPSRASPNAMWPPAQYSGTRVSAKTIHGKVGVDMGIFTSSLEETVFFTNYLEAANVGGMNNKVRTKAQLVFSDIETLS